MLDDFNYHINKYTTGASLHYPMLYGIILGMEAKNVMEFGAGYSTRFILKALDITGGNLLSYSKETREELSEKRDIDISRENWTHFTLTSDHIQGPPNTIKDLIKEKYFDVVFHDGSHSYEVVSKDIEFVVKYMRNNSILMVHDTQNSKLGRGLLKAIKDSLNKVSYSMITIPYGFGLSVIRINNDNPDIIIERKKEKSTSFCDWSFQ